MAKKISKSSHIVGGCANLLVILAAASKLVNSSTPLTSQYIGAQSSGNEHVLLFKLPQSISSQLQGQLEQRTSAEINLVANQIQQNQQAQQRMPQQQAERPFRSAQLDPGTVEQMISLTIPLPTGIRASSVEEKQQRQQLYVPLRDYDSISYEKKYAPNAIGQQPAELSYELGEQALLQQQRQLEYSILIEKLRTEQQQQYYKSLSAAHEQNQLSNLTSILEQHLKQLVLQQYLRNQVQEKANQQQALNPPPTATYIHENQPQPQLWKDTQPNYYGDNQTNRTSTKLSLLSKLASSSPELLQRLKLLINQAAAVTPQNASQSPGELGLNGDSTITRANYTLNEPHKTLYSDQKSAGLAQNQLAESLAVPQYLGQGNSSSYKIQNNTATNEDSKVPLVVIAVPRIVAARKDSGAQIGINLQDHHLQQPHLSNLTLPQPLMGNPNILANASAINNLVDSKNILSLSPSLFLDNLQVSKNFSYNNFTENQMNHRTVHDNSSRFETTTSMPQHTMAPYAQQFNVQGASPVSRHFNPANYQLPLYLYPDNQIGPQSEPITSELTLLQNSTNYLNDQPIQVQQQELASHTRQPTAGLQFQIFHESGEPLNYQGEVLLEKTIQFPKLTYLDSTQYHNRYDDQQSKLNNNEYHPTLAEANDQIQYADSIASRQHQHPSLGSVFIPLNALQQIYSTKQANFSLHDLQQANSFVEHQQQRVNSNSNNNQLMYQANSQKVESTNQPLPVQTSGISLVETPGSSFMESSLGKLKPLFQINTRKLQHRRSNQQNNRLSTTADALDLNENKLTNGQLLNLFSVGNPAMSSQFAPAPATAPATERRNSFAAIGNNRANKRGPLKKRAPKMLVMIV